MPSLPPPFLSPSTCIYVCISIPPTYLDTSVIHYGMQAISMHVSGVNKSDKPHLLVGYAPKFLLIEYSSLVPYALLPIPYNYKFLS